MSISIDGEVHSSKAVVKYGEPFPKPYENRIIEHPDYGDCNIYIVSVGHPKWSEKMVVHVPMKYYITQIVDPNKTYRINKKRKENNLQLVKG